MKDEAITRKIIGSAMRIHSALGPGLLESVYESVMFRDMTSDGMKVERQKRVEFEFEGMKFNDGLRIDLLVEDRVIIEIKNKKMILPVHRIQLYSYLKLSKLEVGLLINFRELHLRDGIIRVVNSHPSNSSNSSVRGIKRKN